MHVAVVAVMVVFVVVHDIVVNVDVRMRFVAPRLADPPGEVHQAECQQHPSGQAAARGFESDQRRELRAQQYADSTEQYGTQHVTSTADHRDAQCLRQRPASCLAHDRKNNVVIRAEYRVQEPDGCRREQEYLGVVHRPSVARHLPGGDRYLPY